jgi:hypothetical protein
MDGRKSIRSYEEWEDFSHEVHRFVDDIPRVKPQKSSDIYSEEWEEHDERDIYPASHMMISAIPVGMYELEWGKSCDQSSQCGRRDHYDIEVDHLDRLPEVDKVREDIEWVREEEKPESEKYPVEKSSFLHCHHREKVWDHREDEIPYESSENRISTRDIDSDDRKKSSIETESDVSVEVHR